MRILRNIQCWVRVLVPYWNSTCTAVRSANCPFVFLLLESWCILLKYSLENVASILRFADRSRTNQIAPLPVRWAVFSGTSIIQYCISYACMPPPPLLSKARIKRQKLLAWRSIGILLFRAQTYACLRISKVAKEIISAPLQLARFCLL